MSAGSSLRATYSEVHASTDVIAVGSLLQLGALGPTTSPRQDSVKAVLQRGRSRMAAGRMSSLCGWRTLGERRRACRLTNAEAVKGSLLMCARSARTLMNPLQLSLALAANWHRG